MIGGASAFNEALESPLCKTVYLTKILQEIPCDTFITLPDPKQFADDPDYTVEVCKMGNLISHFLSPTPLNTIVCLRNTRRMASSLSCMSCSALNES